MIILMSQLVQVNCQDSNPCEYKKQGKASDPTSCSKYYECKNFNGVEKSCPTGEHFSVQSRGCVPVRQSGCYLSTTPVTVRKGPGPGSNNRLPKPGSKPGSESGPGSGNGSKPGSDSHLVSGSGSRYRCIPNTNTVDLFFKYEDLGKTYYISKNNYSTAADAEAMCTTLCAHLAEIDDKSEGDRVIAMMARLDTFGLLIGGKDNIKEGHWVYDRTGKSVKYFDWCTGEPNNYDDEDCMGYEKHRSCMLDFPCLYRYAPFYLRYVCEK
ncbi:unnamed protein product [Lymnaea stagnalis]|uniref:C-type lectin domain-containing protein n=2 Tax=Lymnaea stagnalis TaxID=6523 RepID=A0AAV2INM7_LYMST